VRQVEHRTFSGALAAARGQRVLYVTERCGVPADAEGLELIEVAPGVDLERDVLGRMDFRPLISPQLATMDARLFDEPPLGLRLRLLEVPLAERLDYRAGANMLFINFEGLRVDDRRGHCRDRAHGERTRRAAGPAR
jgi:propionate CoA-transferase